MDLDAKDIFYISLFLSEKLYFIDVGHEKKEERRRKEKELGGGGRLSWCLKELLLAYLYEKETCCW